MVKLKDVFYVMSHGTVQSSEVLDNEQRFGLPIVYVGTEGKETRACPSLLLIPYFMKIHGKLFMNQLLRVLLEYGENYNKEFHPKNTKVEKDIRFLFDVNTEERKIFPQNVIRAYYGDRTTVLNVSLSSALPNETFVYSAKINDNPKANPFQIGFEAMVSYKGSKYSIDSKVIDNHQQVIQLVNPFGIFKFDNTRRTFEMKHRITQTIYPLKEVLNFIHEQSKEPAIVYMIHCKSPDKNLLMDFDFKEYPIEKIFAGITATRRTKKRKSRDDTTVRPTKRTKVAPKTPTPKKTPTKKRASLNETSIAIRKKTDARPTKRTKVAPKTPTPNKKRASLNETSIAIRKKTDARPTKRTKVAPKTPTPNNKSNKMT